MPAPTWIELLCLFGVVQSERFSVCLSRYMFCRMASMYLLRPGGGCVVGQAYHRSGVRPTAGHGEAFDAELSCSWP